MQPQPENNLVYFLTILEAAGKLKGLPTLRFMAEHSDAKEIEPLGIYRRA